jgi:hypothetical protein
MNKRQYQVKKIENKLKDYFNSQGYNYDNFKPNNQEVPRHRNRPSANK